MILGDRPTNYVSLDGWRVNEPVLEESRFIEALNRALIWFFMGTVFIEFCVAALVTIAILISPLLRLTKLFLC